MPKTAAGISEIFSSLQGEGTHLGERHIFVRFEKCNIHCEYCDELDKAGTDFSLESIMSTVLKLEHDLGPHLFVSLTGGEPLLYGSFLEELCPALKNEKFKIYLETNGILWKQLERIIDFVDVVAMDLKPPSITKEKSFLNEHREFLKIARQKETLIKVVVSKELELNDFYTLCGLVESIHPEAPFIIQPISDGLLDGSADPELMRLLMELQQVASGFLRNVRIVPRLHKILNIQ